MITVEHALDLTPYVGFELGVSDWISLDEGAIAQFGVLTGDTHWMHTDPDRARTEAEFGGVIAHGFFALATVTGLATQCYEIRQAHRWLNYGLDRVRFTHPIRPTDRFRLRLSLSDLAPRGHGVQLSLACVLELQNATRPALAAHWIVIVIEDES